MIKAVWSLKSGWRESVVESSVYIWSNIATCSHGRKKSSASAIKHDGNWGSFSMLFNSEPQLPEVEEFMESIALRRELRASIEVKPKQRGGL